MIFCKFYPIIALLALAFLESHLKADEPFFRRQEELVAIESKTEAPTGPLSDNRLVKRIVKAYKVAQKQHLGHSMWQMFFDQRHQHIHQVFLEGNIEAATHILRNPVETDLFWGFDNLTASIAPSLVSIEAMKLYAKLSFDGLLRLGEALGIIPLNNPEAYSHQPPKVWNVTTLIEMIEKDLNITLNFPNPYPEEVGCWTPRGVASYRAIQAIYQAWLIKKILKNIDHPRVLEIGAGLGRTAYYARLLGIEDYTLIDIPMTTIASSYFLGRTVGKENIVLLGEDNPNAEKLIKILTPEAFLNGNESHYDLIVNVDSLTEMDPSIAKAYLNCIEKSTRFFLSINHEVNVFTVNQLLKENPAVKKIQRKPYWMRKGYVEEIVKFK